MLKLKKNAAIKPRDLSEKNHLFSLESSALKKYYALPVEEQRRIRPPYNKEIIASKTVIEELEKIQDRKCLYCECLLEGDPRQYVSHYRPLNNAITTEGALEKIEYYAWLAYEWQNLMLICNECESYKLNFFPIYGPAAEVLCTWKAAQQREQPVLINSFLDNPSKHIEFDSEGRAVQLSPRGAQTIEIVNLNRTRLCAARKASIFLTLEVILNHSKDDIAEEITHHLGSDQPYIGALTSCLTNICRTLETHNGRSEKYRHWNLVERISRLRVEYSRPAWNDAIERTKHNDLKFLIKKTNLGSLSAPIYSQISKITIGRFKGVENFTIDFNRDKSFNVSRSTPCVMLLGENAVGKSTILQAIAIALMPGKDRSRLKIKHKNIIPHEHKDDEKNIDPTNQSKLSITITFINEDTTTIIINERSNKLEVEGKSKNVVFGYGSRRYFITGKSTQKSICPSKTLFDQSSSLPDPTLWLFGISNETFDAVARALRPLLSLRENEYVSRTATSILIQTQGKSIPIGHLSDGYKSLFAMAVDIMRELLKHWQSLESAQGIVLIDEIENHLHPRWKMRVISALRDAMPKVQFIISTHDPLCLRGMQDGEVKVLYRDMENQLKSVHDLPKISQLRVEQILTSDYFGLSSTEDPEQQQALNTIAYYASFDEKNLDENQKKYRDDALEKFGGIPFIGDSTDRQILAEALTRHIRQNSMTTPIDRANAREESVQAIMGVLERAMNS